jgi:hypothetical protein
LQPDKESSSEMPYFIDPARNCHRNEAPGQT